MQTKVQKWGNSLAIRIPKSVALQSQIGVDSTLEMSLEDGKIILRAVPIAPTLDELLAGVTDANRHGEISTGDATGNEAW